MALQPGLHPLKLVGLELRRNAQPAIGTQLELERGSPGTRGSRDHRLHLNETGGRDRARRLRNRCAAPLLTEKVFPMAQRPRIDAHLRRELLRAQPAIIPPLDPLLPFSTTRAPSRFHAPVVPDSHSPSHERGRPNGYDKSAIPVAC